MAEEDYYDILGIQKNATESEIKKAYRKKAMEYHPDRNPDDKTAEERFKKVGEAYTVLSNPQKRQQYDRFGKAGMKGAAGFGGTTGGFDPFDIFREVFGGGGFGDIFGMGGGATGRRSNVQRGSDLQIRLKLTLEEIAEGVVKKIKIKRYGRCETCSGSGAKPGTGHTTCSTCHGRGEVAYRQGFFTVSQTCPACHGEGKTIEKPCSACGGDGRVRGETTLEVQVPAGVSQGQYLTLQNKGNAGPRGGPNGDVIVLIEEKPHKYFERHGDDLIYTLRLGLTQMALGDEVHVPTLTGKAKITIAPGTQNDKILRMRGKGIPHLDRGGAGDELIRVSVYIPEKLDQKEKKLLKELSQYETMYPRKGEKGFFERVKQAFS